MSPTAPTAVSPVGADLRISVDRRAEVPLGVQLAWALRCRIREGELLGGERLPGLRELAEAAGVNVNTVRSVYQRLEQEGLIETRQGSGTFVAPAAGTSLAAAIAHDAAREARATGLDPREVAAALYVSAARAHEPRARELDAGAERRRALRAQIGALERTLGELQAEHPGLRAADTRPPAHLRAARGPALLSVAELEDVRAELLRRLSAVQAAIDELAGAARQARGPRARAAPTPTPARAAAPAGKRARRSKPPRPATAGA